MSRLTSTTNRVVKKLHHRFLQDSPIYVNVAAEFTLDTSEILRNMLARVVPVHIREVVFWYEAAT